MNRSVLGALLMGVVSGSAQSQPILTLQPGLTIHRAEFSDISGLRELEDGRVLIADRRENRLVIVDLRSGKVETVGRQGAGPGEFTRIAKLFALRGDSTLMPDEGTRRWLVLYQDRVVLTVRPEESPLGAGYASILGVDDSGRVLAARFRETALRMPARVDSLVLVAIHRKNRRQDTLGYLRSPFPSGASSFGGMIAYKLTPESRHAAAIAVAQADRAVMYPDGWVAIVRRMIPRVDWYAPTGRRGPVSRPSTAANWIAQVYKMGLAERNATRFNVASPSIVAAADGRLLVLQAANDSHSGTRYDVIDRYQGPVGVLVLAEEERILGFGARSVYVVVTDEVGLQKIQRHPWP